MNVSTYAGSALLLCAAACGPQAMTPSSGNTSGAGNIAGSGLPTSSGMGGGGGANAGAGGFIEGSAGGSSGSASSGAAHASSGAGGVGGSGQGGETQAVLPAKILCVGDSITEQEASWIYPLQDALRAAGCQFELIGLDEGPYNGPYAAKPGYDWKRVAAGGFSTTGVLNYIKEKGTGGVPDVVVEYLGVNNVYGGYIDGKYNPDNRADPDGSYIEDNRELFAMIRAQNARAALLLMKIENGALPIIDAAIDSLAATQSTP